MAVNLEQFSNEPIYRATVPCPQVLEELQQLGQLDAHHEKKQARATTVGRVTLAAGVLCLFVGMLGMSGEGIGMPLAWGGTVLALVGITAFILRSRYQRLNLENRRYELTWRVVWLLQADISPDEPVTLELDLRPATHSDKYQNEGSTRSGWTVKHYLDPWLSLQGRLLDGTHFRLEMTERVQLRNRTKTNARGKMKSKSKQLSAAFLRVRLRVKPERYQHLERLGSSARGAVQMITGTQIKNLTVEADRVDMTLHLRIPWVAGHSEPPPSPGSSPGNRSTEAAPLNGQRVVATALLSLYQILNLSRALDKKAVHSRA
ncbi:hypothetical protein ATI61_114162 [Archangium gephyra]|uniref:DUF3137 domain-containing protein n=1 Tax=Archangium gephyra TaxID=48 RepID=A0AAC8Q4U5_9BACT|nr:hypothetical protein [Archangium gephyra]AKJ01129.1 Hypothetical protein AA314_02755 [Archangium gephyra]REG24554.1 hypothetical protein ATI61_114162 [Archangium gephyra]